MSTDVLQLLIGGVLLGGIYGLAAFGLSVSFGVLNVLNLAHGEFLVLGALLSCAAFEAWGINPFALAVLVIPVFGLAGAAFYLLLLRPIGDKPPHELLVASILVTLGASLTMEDLAVRFWDRPVTGIDYSLPALELGGVVVSGVRLVILAFICALAAGLQIYLRRSFAGKGIRAIIQSREGAKVSGVPINLIAAVTFGLGVALAASAGVFYVTLFAVTPSMGIPLTIKYLCVVVLGGLGSLVGSVVGGLILGLAESATTYYVGAEWAPTIAFVLLIAVLVVRPQGLFGRAG